MKKSRVKPRDKEFLGGGRGGVGSACDFLEHLKIVAALNLMCSRNIVFLSPRGHVFLDHEKCLEGLWKSQGVRVGAGHCHQCPLFTEILVNSVHVVQLIPALRLLCHNWNKNLIIKAENYIAIPCRSFAIFPEYYQSAPFSLCCSLGDSRPLSSSAFGNLLNP